MISFRYFARWFQVNLAIFIKNIVRKYPIMSLTSLTFMAVGTYFTLDQFVWGKQVLNILIALFSSEALAYRLYQQGFPFWEIIICFLVADAIAITVDIMIVNGLLKWHWSTIIINAVASSIRTFKSEFRKRFGTTNGFDQIDKITNHLNNLKKKPSKAGLFTVFCLGLLPRIPPFPGGLSIGVFILRYNKYGYLGWIVLITGMLVRHSITLGAIYEVSYFF